MQARSPRVRKKRGYHHGDLRAALLAAAFGIARRSGADAVTLRAVAERAGVSAPAAYHHFPSKRALLSAAASMGFADLDRRFEAALSSSDDPSERVVALGAAYVTFAIEEPGAFNLVVGAHVADLDLAALPEVAEPGRRAKGRLLDAVRDFCRGNAADPATVAVAVWAQALGTATLVVEKELDPRGVDAPDVLAAATLASDAVRRLLSTYR